MEEANESGLAKDDNFQGWTYNLIGRRCAGDVTLDLSSLPFHSVLDWITGDDWGACETEALEDYRTECQDLKAKIHVE